MAFIKHSDAEVLSILASDEDDIICYTCGGIMKKEGITYICDNCEIQRYLIRRDDELSANN